MLRRKCSHEELIQRIYMLRRGAFVETEHGIGIVVKAYDQIKNTADVYFGDGSIREISPCDIDITSIEAKINMQTVAAYGDIVKGYEEIAVREDLTADKLETISRFIEAHDRTVHVDELSGINVVVGTISLNEKIFRDVIKYDDPYESYYTGSQTATYINDFSRVHNSSSYLCDTSTGACHDFSYVDSSIYYTWLVRDFVMLGYNLQTKQVSIVRDRALSYPIEDFIKDKLLRGKQCQMIRRMNSEER